MNEEIIEKYTTTNISVESLAKEYKVGKLKIKKILSDGGIPIRPKGGISKNRPVVEFTMDLTNKSIKCKKCGFISTDIENKSGVAIRHIQECFPDIEIPSKLKRTNYKKENGLFWYFQYFDIVESKYVETIKCPECDWTSPDLTNKTGALTKHVEKCHGNLDEFTKRNPEYLNFFNPYIQDIERENELLKDSVTCKICGKKFKYVNEKHLSTHNISLREYKLKYLGYKFLSESTTQKLKDSYEINLKHHESSYKSHAEIEISEFIESFGFNVLSGDKKNLKGIEIDVFIPELNIGFEYNGLYYHTEKMGKTKWFHLEKQNIAKENGVLLYHIFEDEWIDKKEIIKKKIIHIIGKNENKKIYGRDTIIKKINKEETEYFLEKNHIQGSAPRTTINYGSYYNNELIGVMSFIKRETYWELIRFATHIDYRCVGISGKLLKNFIDDNNPENLITFADRRWTINSENNLYTQMGFKLDGTLSPEYKYFYPKLFRNQRIHKFNFRKQKLVKRFPEILNMEMSENDMIEVLGCDKIWDCGLFRYKMTF